MRGAATVFRRTGGWWNRAAASLESEHSKRKLIRIFCGGSGSRRLRRWGLHARRERRVDDSSYEPLSSTLKERIEVTVRAERRRRWRAEQKLQIVKETLAPGVITSLVARRHGISTGLLYTWRKQALAGAMAGFMPVRIVPEALPAPLAEDAVAPLPRGASASDHPAGLIEIELTSGVRLRVDAEVDGRALGRVLAALRDR